MNKSDLVSYISKEAGLSKVQATNSVNAFTEAITKSLERKENVTLVGFGTFAAKARAERKGRNPTNGEELTIPATVVPTFKAGSTLKERVKKSKKKK